MTVAYLNKQINSDIADLLKVIFSVSLGSVGFLYTQLLSVVFVFCIFSFGMANLSKQFLFFSMAVATHV